MNDTFKLRWPRWMAGISCIAGVALLYVILDVHFFGHIPGATETFKQSWIPNILLGSLGALFFGMGSYLLVRPPLLLDADHSGIRIYPAIGVKQVVGGLKKSQKGVICCIPWGKVSAIAKGKAWKMGFNDTGITPEKHKALLIACNSDIGLGDYSWSGDVAVGLGPATADESAMWPDTRIPGHEHAPHLILNAKYLPCSLSDAVERFSDMKKRYS